MSLSRPPVGPLMRLKALQMSVLSQERIRAVRVLNKKLRLLRLHGERFINQEVCNHELSDLELASRQCKISLTDINLMLKGLAVECTVGRVRVCRRWIIRRASDPASRSVIVRHLMYCSVFLFSGFLARLRFVYLTSDLISYCTRKHREAADLWAPLKRSLEVVLFTGFCMAARVATAAQVDAYLAPLLVLWATPAYSVDPEILICLQAPWPSFDMYSTFLSSRHAHMYAVLRRALDERCERLRAYHRRHQTRILRTCTGLALDLQLLEQQAEIERHLTCVIGHVLNNLYGGDYKNKVAQSKSYIVCIVLFIIYLFSTKL